MMKGKQEGRGEFFFKNFKETHLSQKVFLLLGMENGFNISKKTNNENC